MRRRAHGDGGGTWREGTARQCAHAHARLRAGRTGRARAPPDDLAPRRRRAHVLWLQLLDDDDERLELVDRFAVGQRLAVVAQPRGVDELAHLLELADDEHVEAVLGDAHAQVLGAAADVVVVVEGY